MKTILVPVDFSEGTEAILAEAASLVKVTGDRMLLLHVLESPPATGRPGFRPAGFGLVPLSEQEVDLRLRNLQRQLLEGGVAAGVLQLSGHPASQVLEQANRLAVDYVVIGSHGNGSLAGPMIGRTVRCVLKEARRPVLVVPTGLLEVNFSQGSCEAPVEAFQGLAS